MLGSLLASVLPAFHWGNCTECDAGKEMHASVSFSILLVPSMPPPWGAAPTQTPNLILGGLRLGAAAPQTPGGRQPPSREVCGAGASHNEVGGLEVCTYGRILDFCFGALESVSRTHFR